VFTECGLSTVAVSQTLVGKEFTVLN